MKYRSLLISNNITLSNHTVKKTRISESFGCPNVLAGNQIPCTLHFERTPQTSDLSLDVLAESVGAEINWHLFIAPIQVIDIITCLFPRADWSSRDTQSSQVKHLNFLPFVMCSFYWQIMILATIVLLLSIRFTIC